MKSNVVRIEDYRVPAPEYSVPMHMLWLMFDVQLMWVSLWARIWFD